LAERKDIWLIFQTEEEEDFSSASTEWVCGNKRAVSYTHPLLYAYPAAWLHLVFVFAITFPEFPGEEIRHWG
jgi:hypothetical protein